MKLILILLCFYISSIDDSGQACSFSSLCGELGDSFYISWTNGKVKAVNRNQSIELKISGKCPNFTWIVEGKGFWLDAGHTVTQLVTANETAKIYADGSSCGSAKITVIDNCKKTITMHLTSKVGQWISCPQPDTGSVKLSNIPIDEWLTWPDGKFLFMHWRTRCCEDLRDHSSYGCVWAQCPGQDMPQTTICADDYGTGSCEFGLCWHGSGGGREPGHMRYWSCQP